VKVFGPDIGVVEFALGDKTLAIGRADTADIRLPDPRVSRAHARIAYQEGQYLLEDVGSSGGTTVNRKRVETHVLRHGDTAQIGAYVLQFRTHRELRGATAAARQARLLLHSEFSVLPSGIQLRFRRLETPPREIFTSGDTLRIGQSGLLIPTTTSMDDCVCLELQLSWGADTKTTCYLGEVMGVVEEDGVHWMCVKLHTVSRQTHESAVRAGYPGPWLEALAS